MLKKLIIIASLVLIFPSAWALDRSNEYLVVNNPKVKTFRYRLGNITVGNPNVADFKADRKRKRITIFPKRAGNTMLLIFDTKGKQRDSIEITVYSRDPNLLLNQVRELLVDVEGITIRRLDDKVVIDGEVILPSDKERIKKVVSNSDQIINLSKIDPDTGRIVAKKIQKEIGLDEVNVRSLKGQVILEGEVYSQSSRIKAEKIARLYSDRVINVLDVREIPNPPSRKPTIQITAHFVEIAKNFSKNFNFKWSPIPNIGVSSNYTINPISGSNNFTGAITGTAQDILPKLNYFKALGIARVVENPSVSVKSGSPATIQSNTRIGFPVVQPNGAVSLEFQNVGASLSVTPFASGSDIDMTISVSVSSLGSPDVTGGVAIQESKIETSQLVRSGESIVIGGLVRYASRQTIDRPPVASGTGTNPTASGTSTLDPFPLGSLFTLFKSNDVGKQKSQFLVFITPRLLKFSKDANREIKDAFNLYEVYPDQLSPVGDDLGGE